MIKHKTFSITSGNQALVKPCFVSFLQTDSPDEQTRGKFKVTYRDLTNESDLWMFFCDLYENKVQGELKGIVNIYDGCSGLLETFIYHDLKFESIRFNELDHSSSSPIDIVAEFNYCSTGWFPNVADQGHKDIVDDIHIDIEL